MKRGLAMLKIIVALKNVKCQLNHFFVLNSLSKKIGNIFVLSLEATNSWETSCCFGPGNFVSSYSCWLSQISEQQHKYKYTHMHLPVLVCCCYQKKSCLFAWDDDVKNCWKNKNKKDSKSNKTKTPNASQELKILFFFILSFSLYIFVSGVVCAMRVYMGRKNYYKEGEYLTVKWE